MTQFDRLHDAEDVTVEAVNGERRDRDHDATARRATSSLGGSNVVERGSNSPMSDAELLEANEPYFEYIEHQLGPEAAKRARQTYLEYAHAEKVVPDAGSRLGIVQLPGRGRCIESE